MEKKLIGLYIPAAQQRFDLMVPDDVDIATLTGLLAKGAQELCGGRFVRSQQELLSLRQPEMLLDPGKTLADYGIGDGAQLVLI